MNYFASVIICTYNRCESLRLVLDSLLSQVDDYLIYEVIVSDNNSFDRTKEVLLEYAPKFAGRLKYICERYKGKSSAANSAIRIAKGNIICLTDDDVVLDHHWVSKIVQCFDRHNCDCVGGRVLPIFPEGTAQWIKDHASKLSGSVVIYDKGEKTFEFKGETFPFIGANIALKRTVFKDVGYFRPDLGGGTGTVGEDTEFVDRLLIRGKTLYYCGEALIWHPFDPKRLTLKHMALWNISLGKYNTRMQTERGTRLFYYFGIPRYLIRGVIEDFVRLISFFWLKPAFFIAWRDLFCKLGMIQEYQKVHKKACLPAVRE
jgi:glycosyltransferase involved in cell wall biosynthesis